MDYILNYIIESTLRIINILGYINAIVMKENVIVLKICKLK